MMTLLRFRCERPGDYCRSAATRLMKATKLTGKFFPISAAAFFLTCAPLVHAQTSEPNSTTPSTATAPAPAASPATATTPAIPTPGSTAPAATPISTDATPDTKATAGTSSALIPHDLSPYGMFMNADVVVKAVMIGLAFASLVTWTLLLAKGIELTAARRRAQAGLGELARAQTLGEAASRISKGDTVVGRLVGAALDEGQRSQDLGAEGIKERATALLSRIEARASRAMGRGTGLLATIGSTAPFVGLFGTVWGIMNAFIGISKTNTTNLAVVAPGIAEALLATATGLVAAIPAVIIYNMFARAITGYRQVLADASTEVLRLLSRDLDRGLRSAPRQAAE